MWPVVAPERARRSALDQVVETFFGGSAGDAAAALLDMSDSGLSTKQHEKLTALIDSARKEGR